MFRRDFIYTYHLLQALDHYGSWFARAGVIALIILFGVRHRPGYVIVGEPSPVETEHPITCVHTRLTDEVEEWKIQRSLELVHEMGADTIVEFVPWAYIEYAPHQYAWEHTDMILKHAEAQGLRVIARIGYVPGWVRPDIEGENTSLNYIEPEMYPEFADFVEEFARHYQGKIDTIIIWNEPNLAFEWGYQEVLPERYVEMLSYATPAAHRGNPDVVVLAGALAPTLEPIGSQYGMNETDYLTGLYEAGFSEYYDALAIHTYGFKFPADSEPEPEVLNFRRAELLREIMVAYGDEDKPVIITESGWNDHPRWTKAVRPGQRILYTIDSLEYAEENWPWLKKLCIWALRYPVPTYNWPDYFTLVASDFTPRPIYYELQNWARGWEDQ